MRSQKRAACTASRQPAVKPAYSVQRQCVGCLRGERALAPACRADETKLLMGELTRHSNALSGVRWCILLVISSGD